MGLFPTFAVLAGIDISDLHPLDGRNIQELMTGQSSVSPYDKFLYYRSNQLQAIRSENWKWYLPIKKSKGRLFDVILDSGETTNLAAQHADVIRRLTELAAAAEADLGQGKHMGPGCRPAGKVGKPEPLALQRDQ